MKFKPGEGVWVKIIGLMLIKSDIPEWRSATVLRVPKKEGQHYRVLLESGITWRAYEPEMQREKPDAVSTVPDEAS